MEAHRRYVLRHKRNSKIATLLEVNLHSIHDFIKAYLRPRLRPQLTVRLRPRPSADAQKACGRVRVRTSLV